MLLLYYSTEVLSLAGATAGILILAPKLWSIIWDPLVGGVSDTTTGRWGRRRPFLLFGTGGMCLTFVLLFQAPPAWSGPAAWLGVTYFLLTCLYSVYAVPYVSVPAQISPDRRTLMRLVSWRMVFVMLGVLMGASLAPTIVSAAGGGARGYAVMAIVVASICAFLMLLPLRMLRDRDPPACQSGAATRQSPTFLWRIRMVPDLRRLAVGFVVQATAFAAFSASAPYLVTRTLERPEADIGVAFGVYMLATLAALPAWSRLGASFGLRRAWSWAAISFAMGSMLVGAAANAGLAWISMLLLFALAGVPFAGLQVLPFTLAGEIVRREGGDGQAAQSGLWTAAEKLGLALGPGLSGLAITFLGAGSGDGMAKFVAIAPTLLCLASLPALRPLTAGPAAALLRPRES
jgi:Na+/melibiose symporter-like transporter